MADGMIGRLDAVLSADARFGAALGKLPGKGRAAGWTGAGGEARSAAFAAIGRAVAAALGDAVARLRPARVRMPSATR